MWLRRRACSEVRCCVGLLRTARGAARCEALVLELRRGTAARVEALAFLDWFKSTDAGAYRLQRARSLQKRALELAKELASVLRR